MKRAIGVNERGLRVGQWHHRAKLTDADVDRMLAFREQGASWQTLSTMFDCSIRHCRDVCAGRKRQTATEWRTIDTESPGARRTRSVHLKNG